MRGSCEGKNSSEVTLGQFQPRPYALGGVSAHWKAGRVPQGSPTTAVLKTALSPLSSGGQKSHHLV